MKILLPQLHVSALVDIEVRQSNKNRQGPIKDNLGGKGLPFSIHVLFLIWVIVKLSMTRGRLMVYKHRLQQEELVKVSIILFCRRQLTFIKKKPL